MVSQTKSAVSAAVPVDNNATIEAHLAQAELHGEPYLVEALSRASRPAATRGRALVAAVRHIGRLQSGGPAAAGREHGVANSLASVVAAHVDDGMPTHALCVAAELAGKAKVLPVLVKALCVVAQVKAVRAEYESDGDECEEAECASDEEEGRSKASADRAGDDGDEMMNDDAPLLDATSLKRKAGAALGKRGSSAKVQRVPFSTSVSDKTGPALVNEFMLKLVMGLQTGDSVGDRKDDVFVTSAVREVSLSSATLATIIECLLSRLRSVDVFELPAFIYQLLLLVSSRGTSQTKKATVRTIIHTFQYLEGSAKTATVAASQAQNADEDEVILSRGMSMDTIREVQGTTLLHVDFAIKQDPGLVSELLKLARASADSPHSIMTPFGIAALLALARAPSMQVSVVNAICDSIARHDKEHRLRKTNPFAAQLCAEEEPMRDPRVALMQVLRSTVEDGWDIICEPLLQLAFALLEMDVHTKERKEDCLAVTLLHGIFADHPATRGEIVDQMITRVLLREQSSALAIVTLGVLSRKSPAYLLEHSGKIKDSIGELVSLPPWTSCELTDAYRPLFRMKVELLDYANLVVRKALFHRDASARAVACTGFLRLMAPQDRDGGARTFISSLGPGSQENAATGFTQLQSEKEELAQPLRRALSYPPAIRALMYKEARQLIAETSPGAERRAICSAIRGLLHQHALAFINSSDAPFLALELCVNESNGGRLVEPLGDLLACLTTVETHSDVPLSKTYLMDLARKVASVTVRDFDISKEARARPGAQLAEDGDEGADGEASAAAIAADTANRNRARVLGSVVEAMLNLALSVENKAQQPQLYLDTVFPLLRLRDSVIAILRHLGAVSSADALRDLGGNAEIEPVAGRSVGWFSTNKPSIAGAGKNKNGKKSGSGEKKVKPEGGMVTPGVGASEAGVRFGTFGVLVSSTANPLVGLDVAVRTLLTLTPSIENDDEIRKNLAQWFNSQAQEEDVVRLSSFLRAVAKTHVEASCDIAARHGPRMSLPSDTLSPSQGEVEHKAPSDSICEIVHVAMADFQHHRGGSGATHSKNAVRALELVETCLRVVQTQSAGKAALAERICIAMLPKHAQPDTTIKSFRLRDAMGEQGGVRILVVSLQKAVESLVENLQIREADVVLRILSAVQSLCLSMGAANVSQYAGLCNEMAIWARQVLTETDCTDTAIMKGLVRIALTPKDTCSGLQGAHELSERIRTVLGDCNAESQVPPCDTATDENSLCRTAALSMENSLGAVDVVLDAVDRALSDAEWALGRMMSFEAVATAGGGGGGGAAAAAAEGRSETDEITAVVNCAEDAAQRRLLEVMRVVNELLCSAIAKWAQQERLVKVATRLYRVISVAARAQMRRRDDPRTSFLELLDGVKVMGPLVWNYMAFLSMNEKQVGGRVGPRAVREGRIMPQLVYEAEKLEKMLIGAQKYTKVNLLRGLKRNTARDYRISADMLSDMEHGGDEEEGGAVGQENIPPAQ